MKVQQEIPNWHELAYNKTSVYLWNILVIQKYLEREYTSVCPVPWLKIKTLSTLISPFLTLLSPFSEITSTFSLMFTLPTHFFLLLLCMFVPINIWYSFEDFCNFICMCHRAYHSATCIFNSTLSLKFSRCSPSLFFFCIYFFCMYISFV